MAAGTGLLFYRPPENPPGGPAVAPVPSARGHCRFGRPGVDTFLAGGALGFDTLAAQEVLRLKAAGLPQLRLVLVLPCLGQEAYWKAEDAALYRDLLRQADEAIYTADVYSKWCMFQRDRYLVNHSAYCLCYWNREQGERGGTAYTVGYARKQGLEVENLGDFPLLNG